MAHTDECVCRVCQRCDEEPWVVRFEHIQRRVRCAHSLGESVWMATQILQRPDVLGALVECGVYRGGMTAKWSWIAQRSKRLLWAYDSFRGLPPLATYARGAQQQDYRGKSYRASMWRVRYALWRYGVSGRVTVVPGWFRQTLAFLPDPIAFAFVDVDLARSLEECLGALWPRMSPGGALFCHEARDPAMQRVIEAQGLREYGVGVGTGLGAERENLCVLWKPA